MAESHRIPFLSTTVSNRISRLPQFLTAALLIGVLIILTIVPLLATAWMRIPFIGGFLEQTLLVSPSIPDELPQESAARLGSLAMQGQLARMDGLTVSSPEDFNILLYKTGTERETVLSFRKLNGEIVDLQVTLGSFPAALRFSFMLLPVLVAIVYFLSAMWIYWLHNRHGQGRAFVILLCSIALLLAVQFDRFSTHRLTWLWGLAFGLLAGALFDLGAAFSRDDPLQARRSPLRASGYLAGILLALLALPWLDNMAQPQVYLYIWALSYLLTAAGAAYLLARILPWLEAAPPVERDLVRLLLYAALFSFGPLVVWMSLSLISPGLRFTPYLFLLMLVFPMVAAYAARRERLFRLNYVLSRTMLYGAVALLVALGYALVVTGLSLVITGLAPVNPVLAGLIFFVLALLFSPARQSLQNHLDRAFFRGERAFQERLQSFSSEMTNLMDLTPIIKTLSGSVERALLPSRLQIFLYDPLSGLYGAVPDENGRVASDLHFAPDSALIQTLQGHNGALFLSSSEHLPDALKPDAARVRLLDAHVFVPLPGQSRLVGWLALGPRLSGEPYTARELNFLDTLCDQAAVAVERAQVAARMENRAHEMAVLTRLAQGINVTLSFDDILELIFAQSEQLIPMDDYQLILLEEETRALVTVFYIEQDERLNARENRPYRAENSLEREVIRLRRPIMTDDYGRECHKRGITPQMQSIFAWMCVPLNAGAETIGVLVAANRNSAVEYTQEQLQLLQSVADQAAGAIVKTRLLHEAERRARQLATLNEVTRKLTSTLELGPLLQTILDSAVDILNCEAGSLLMVDEHTDELVFEVVVSPVATDLLHQRIPANTGLAGKAVKTRQTILVNNVHESPDWFSKTDQQTGFVTRSVLVTPLVIKENVIGVIEVINRNDGLSFNRDDESLLSAFAAQAAIAIENARLYTMTDQALAARVEELSVMQRIDRELNASLDTGRAVMTTLEWAMRQSGATAGLLGILDEERPLLQVMASQGYSEELRPYENGLFPLEALSIAEVIETGVAIRRVLEEGDPGGVLAGARSQAVIAIQREGKVTGILLLENAEPELVSEDVLSFLLRLSDHASIAISNAQLYAFVQQANAAKSEFVSFVSHELKNPMTSVKGFTELLASGVVGPINEAQGNFLNTIRSNIERMNTLISDLNDVSKIEANRLRLDFKAFPLGEVVEEVARSTKRQVEDKEQTLVIQPLAELPSAWADRTRVVQVIVNLVSNANKYTEKGGVINLGAEVCDNQWDAQGARRVLHIWVADNGIGISEADQKKIFQKFFRSDDPKTREANGTGLGLNITRSLIEMQGGRIWFESEFRKGTTFHFTVPIAE